MSDSQDEDYSTQAFTHKASHLKNTQASINAFSAFLMKHSKDANVYRQVLADWKTFVQGNLPPQLLINLIYAANDYVQSGRHQQPKIARDMFPAIEIIFKRSGKMQDKELLRVLQKLLGIWSERNVYDPHAIKQLEVAKNRLSTGDKNAPRSPKESPLRPPAKKVRLTYDAEAMGKVSAELIHLLGQLADPPSADLETRKQISNFQPHIGNIDSLTFVRSEQQAQTIHDDVKEKETLVRDYCRSLSQEVMNRRQKLNLLEDFIKHVRATTDRYVEQMQWLKNQKEALLLDHKAVETAFESLPDEEPLDSTNESLPSHESLFVSHNSMQIFDRPLMRDWKTWK